ncbi:MaoC/PaaZ C-terminal domain-containing protein [Streptomyces sp. NPDC052052]|uniref:MaoC/PaaZ C-terminal domain-containing protein n=1 Tax=Streptomyces sp. NPDC052052 TaxID=3154756 RepID=UPI003413EA22
MAETARRTADQDFETGRALPPFVRVAGLEAWNRYAAVNDEFVGIHMDDAAGQAAGYPGAIGMGNLVHAWLHALIEDWLDGRGRLTSLECRFRAPALKGDEVTCAGVVQEREPREDGSTQLLLDLWADRHTGDRLVTARAVVLLSS